MKEKWNGKISSLIVSEDGNPELYEELSRISHRERSARFRMLALVGLYALRNQAYPSVGVPHTGASEADASLVTQDAVSSRLENKKALLGDKLRGSVQAAQ